MTAKGVSRLTLSAPSDCQGQTDPAADYRAFDHITWIVGNAKQAASYFVTRMGFQRVAYRGLETGSRSLVSQVVTNNGCTFVLTSPVRQPSPKAGDLTDELQLELVHNHLTKHGDGVKDVAFETGDARAGHSEAVANGATSVQEATIIRDDDGEVVIATVEAYGDTTHTFVERSRYRGVFLPGFKPVTAEDPMAALLPPVPLETIDHCVGNQDWGNLEATCA